MRTDVYCYIEDPATLTWEEGGVMAFANNKATKFHVKADALDAWTTTFPDANVTFVGDLSDQPAVIKGDVNGDGTVDIADAVCIVNHVVGKPNIKFDKAAADANGDNDVDIADAVHIVNYVVGKISALSRSAYSDR